EAVAVLETCAASLPGRVRHDVARAIRGADWSATPSGAETLAGMIARDGSGRVARLARLIESAAGDAEIAIDADDVEATAARSLARWGLGYVSARRRGLDPEGALEASLDDPHVAAEPLLAPLRASSGKRRLRASASRSL